MDKQLEDISSELIGLARQAMHDGVDHSFLATRRDVDGSTILEGNRHGLLRFAAHCVALAGKTAGSHLHFDAYSDLSDSEVGIVVVRVGTWEEEK